MWLKRHIGPFVDICGHRVRLLIDALGHFHSASGYNDG